MRIKEIIIDNFTSFGECTIIEPFDQGHNVIVGSNGGGKSNVFLAIQFVLDNEFTHLTFEQRKNWLHDGTLSGFVEIIFHSLDGRVSLAENEVSVRRTFNKFKDEYTLNNRVVLRVQVMEALENAGFNICNPFYIVDHKTVHHLAMLQDNNDRLELFKKIAGLEQYAELYSKALEKLNYAQDKVLKINDLIKYHTRRLNTVEQKDLREFNKQDELRRVLERLVHESELSETKQKFTDLELLHTEADNQQITLELELQCTQAELDRYFRIANETKMNISFLEKEKEDINHHYQSWIKTKVKLTLIVEDLKTGKTKVNVENKLNDRTNQIQESETELEVDNCRFDKVNAENKQKNREIRLKEHQLAELYEKQNRCNHFLDRAERDIWIREKLESINKQITVKREHEDFLSKGIKVDVETENKLVKRSEEYARTMEQNRAFIEDYKNQCQDYDEFLEQCRCLRNELSSEESIKPQYLLHLQEELNRANEKFAYQGRVPDNLKLIEQIEETTQKFSEEKNEMDQIDIKLNSIPLEILKCRGQIIELQVCIDRVDEKMLLLKNKLISVQEARASKKKALATAQSDLECLSATKQSLHLELEQNFLRRLPESDKARLNSLNEEIQILRKDVKKNKLSALNTELEEHKQKIECAAKDLAEKDCRINEMLLQVGQAQIELTRLTSCKKATLVKIDKQSEVMETFMSKQILLDQKITEVTVKMNEGGGALSDDMYKQYSGLSLSSLVKEMDKVTNVLKKYHHVNNKPVLQSRNGSIELERLLQKKPEVLLCLQKCQDVLDDVNNRKLLTFSNAFMQVSRYFAEAFHVLVPAGRVRLVVLSTDVEEGYEYLPAATNMNNFVGVAIRVTIRDVEDPMYDIMQLSSGEKLLATLGLIFAIQKFKPASFYLFDEIDRGLDRNYRDALGRLIHELSDENQFITIICRPQLLRYAEKFYAVTRENSCSCVKRITQNYAAYFV